MYEIDKLPNSNEKICENCGDITDETEIIKTIDGKEGCEHCVDNCQWCGNSYLKEDMYSNPFLGYVCNACLSAEDYNKASDAEIEKHALRCLFDATKDKRVEDLIINLAWKKGYFQLAHELKNDK